jgi:hypothetical protein
MFLIDLLYISRVILIPLLFSLKDKLMFIISNLKYLDKLILILNNNNNNNKINIFFKAIFHKIIKSNMMFMDSMMSTLKLKRNFL